MNSEKPILSDGLTGACPSDAAVGNPVVGMLSQADPFIGTGIGDGRKAAIMKTTFQVLKKRAIAAFETRAGKSVVFRTLVMMGCVTVSAEAELIQHLDAAVAASVAGNPVTQWKDQSGRNNHAAKKNGVVSYPSATTFESGLTGLKFGPAYSSMTLFPTDSWLDQRSGNGFCVLVAFKVDSVNADNDVLGNDDAVNSGGLNLRFASDGSMRAYLGKIVNTKEGQKISNGDTVAYAINYNPTTGIFEFWDSKNYDSLVDEIDPANFSLGYPVTLGDSGHTGRFLNGLVGEVKIYDAALGADLFKAEREAMASKWANIANMSEIRWRVIPEDSDYPTDDVIMAAVSVDDSGFANPLPADPANNDCTATFQEAIDTVSQANGGTVWVPEGEYRFDNNLILRGGVSLRGRWNRPSAANWNPGSVLKIYHGQDNPDGDAFITLSGGGNATIKELTFWHPNQSPTNIKPYPYVIAAYTGLITPENLTFVNAYRGMNQLEAGFGLVRGLYGTTLETGLMSDSGEAVPRFESLYAGPQYWEWWPLDNAVANSNQPGNYAHFMLNSGTFFRIQNMDVFSFYNADISGYSVGFVMENSDGGSADNGAVPNHGQVSGVNIHDCQIAMHVKVGSFSTGLKSTFSGSQYGIYSVTDGNISLTECDISGGTYAAYNASGSEFRLNAKSCTINGPVRFEDGTLELKACNFTSAGTHVTATSGMDRGVVWGCTYNKTQPVTIAGSAYMDVDHSPMNYKPLPEYKINPLTDWNTVRKPAKTNLFDVVAYGAKGDGKNDDTAAVKAAISAAKLNGGGIVFFPFGAFGRYRITDNLDLGAGVELRGIGQRGPVGEYKSQSIIFVEKSGAADGTPFIAMGDGSGLRGGLVFWYPANNWDRVINGGQDFVPYPYTIYAHGTNNYIIACTTPNAYQFADIDAATDPLIDMMLTGGLHKVYRVRGGTTGCRIMTGHVKPSGMWGNLTDIPNNKANYTVFGGVTAKELEIFYLQECEDLTILGMFCRESQSIMTCNGAQGRIIGTAGEGVQNGFIFQSAGATPLHLIDTKPNMSEQGDGTGKSGILVEPTFNGTLNMFGGAEQGAADYKFKVLSGNVHAQERKNVNSGWAQLRGIHVGGNAQLSLYDNVLDHPFSLNVESNAVLKLDHSHFPSGIPYATVEGSLVIDKCDINENCILSVPGQTQFSQHGLILDQSNTTRVANKWSYSEKLTSGDSFNLNVTESAFADSKVNSVDFNIGIYLGSSGSNTVSVYYDSSTGEKLGRTTAFSNLDGRVKIVSFSVSDARFGSDTSDIRIQVADPAAAAGLSYIWVRGTPALEPPFDLTASGGAGFVSLDWKGKSHWQFGSYSVHRATVSGGPYSQIAANVTTTAFTDTNVTFGSRYYYALKTVNSSGVETLYSKEVSETPMLYLPHVSFLAPSSNITVTAGTDLYVRVNATDPEGISRVWLYKDGVQLARSEGAAPYEWGAGDPALTNLAAGSFVLTAQAKDKVGDIGQTVAGITVTVLPATYTLTVNNGSGDGSYKAGSNVVITAEAAPVGQVFDQWVSNSGSATIANANAATTTLTISNTAVIVSATYKAVPGGYEAWASTNGVGEATADDDGDGCENLLEYAIGGNPKSGIDTKPAIELIGNSLHYSFKRRNDDSDLTFILQGSPDLMNETWSNLDPAVSTTSTDGKYDHVTLTITEEISRYFLRLEVTSTK